MKISPARIAAFDILLRIERDSAYSSILLPEYEQSLERNDGSLCHEITLGVLRKKLHLDAVIDGLSSGRKLDIEVRVALWIGLYQLMELDRVPDHAAINDSVQLVARAKKSSAKGFVNAILRSYQRQRFIPETTDVTVGLALETSHPFWLVERWINQFGFKRTQELCVFNNQPANLAFRIYGEDREVKNQCDELVDSEIIKPSEFVNGCYLVKLIDKIPRSFFNNGNLQFQDEGSQLVGQITAAEGGNSVLDVCAAPGGKTLMLAASGAFTVAGDVYEQRVRLLSETVSKKASGKIVVVKYDARQPLPFLNETFDTVVVDAPCSGTGTIQHNPEIRYSISEIEIGELTSKQLLILQNASELVKIGGCLIYSTCSLEEDENEQICEKFINETDSFRQATPKVSKHFLTERGFARTFPPKDEMGGFFTAVFERV
ncbi:MAG: 16S rRNA (cytosine(967)-C(5))-methyltransferase RsmB [Pyrinomonadaceae bacterium]